MYTGGYIYICIPAFPKDIYKYPHAWEAQCLHCPNICKYLHAWASWCMRLWEGVHKYPRVCSSLVVCIDIRSNVWIGICMPSHWLQVVIFHVHQCLSRSLFQVHQVLSRLLLTMDVILQKVFYLKTMLVTPTSNDALLRTLADLDGLGNIAPDVFKSTAFGTY